MTIIRFVYIIFHIIMIWMFFRAGKNMSISISDKQYWKASLPAFLAYFVVLGLRFGHNLDWNLYYIRYTECTSFQWSSTEPIYQILLYFFNAIIGLPYFLFISLQCVFLLYCFVLIVKEFRDKLYYVMPLFPIVVQMNDCYIRWFIAVSFFLISIYKYLRNGRLSKISSLLWFTCAVLTHNGSIILLLIYPILLQKKHFVPPKISLLLLFLSVFVFSIAIFGFLNDFFVMISLFGGQTIADSNVSHYLLSVDRITNDGLSDLTGVLEHSIVGNIIIFLSYTTTIIYGPKYLQCYKNGIVYYNLFVIAAILNPIFSTVEIFDRFTITLLIFNAVVSGIVFYEIVTSKRHCSLMAYLLCMVSIVCFSYPYFRYTFMVDKDYRMMYIWDAGEKEYIDPYLYYKDMGRF